MDAADRAEPVLDRPLASGVLYRCGSRSSAIGPVDEPGLQPRTGIGPRRWGQYRGGL